MPDATRLMSLSMAPPLAEEVVRQIATGVGDWRRLMALSMPTGLAIELASQIDNRAPDQRRLWALSMVPQLAEEVAYQIENGFSPLYLFAGGEQGVWYDPSDLSSMFQDVAATIPAVVGQPVALIRDKSGNGHHATQATAASMPILRQDGARYYLEFDGVNDFLVTNSIDLTATDEIGVFVGIRKTSDVASGLVVELSATNATNNGVFTVFAPSVAATANLYFASKGTALSGAAVTGWASPVTAVLSGLAKIANPSRVIRINGAQVGASGVSQGTGNYGNFPLYIGRRGGASNPFTGRVYGIVALGRLPIADETSATETFLNERTGAY